MIKRSPQMTLAQLLRLSCAGGREGGGSGASYVGYTRFGLANLFKLLGYRRGDKILLPAYICDVVLLPFAELGLEPVYYAIDANFQIDWDSVTVPPGAKAVITVNYFGVSIDFAAVREFAERHGLLWISDNAHGFASCLGDGKLEAFGDVSFTSFRKTIPSVNGARVLINSGRYRHLKEGLDRLNDAGEDQPRLRYLLAAAVKSLGVSLRQLPDFSDIAGFCDTDPARYRVDAWALKLLSLCDEGSIREKRRALYHAVERHLADSTGNIAALPGLLRENNSPLVFPALTQSRESWLAVLKRSREAGMDIHTWPSLPAEVIADNRCGAVDTWNKMLYLPLHQDLEPSGYLAQLQRVLHAV